MNGITVILLSAFALPLSLDECSAAFSSHEAMGSNGEQVEPAVVFLGDIKCGKAIESAATKPVIDQQTCTFSPHVQVLVIDQPIDIVNRDPIAHNAHVTQNMMTVVDPLQPRPSMERVSLRVPRNGRDKAPVPKQRRKGLWITTRTDAVVGCPLRYLQQPS